MNNKLKNIVVVGQGAMGLLWYHHLSTASAKTEININRKVSLLASNQASLNKNNVISAQYQFTAYQAEEAISKPLTYCQSTDIENADVIVLCLKSFHIASALENIAKDINPDCLIILAHNGMGTIDSVTGLLPNNQVILAMLTTHGCLRSAPFAITHTGLGQSDIGLLNGKLTNKQQQLVTTLLSNALPEAKFHQDIEKMQWQKLAINCVINPITAINNIDNGEVNNDRFTEQSNAVLAEIIEVSKAENIDLTYRELQTTVHKVALATARNCSSMRSDVLAGKPTEVDYINGFIHRLGLKNNIATPENSRLWQQVLNLKT